MKKTQSGISKLLIIVLAIRAFVASAQTPWPPPPTGGSGPSSDDKSSIVLPVVAGAVVAGTAAYFIFKKKPVKIPPRERVTTYLYKNNIQPTQDAINLIFALNPSIPRQDNIPSNYKLKGPDFPEMPQPVTQEQLPGPALNEQLMLFKSSLEKFRKSRKPNAGGNNSGVTSNLNTAEKNVDEYMAKKENANKEQSGLIADLISVLNQLVKRNTASVKVNGKDAELIQNIIRNLSEILYPPELIKKNKQSSLYLKSIQQELAAFYYSVNNVALNNDEKKSRAVYRYSSARSKPAANDPETKGFAFAVYKIHPDGTIITKGPEVEKKYTIRYVCPALQEFESSYHVLSNPATWAFANLYPSKYYIQVRDIFGKQVPLQNPLIDVQDIYERPQQQYHNKMMIIPIYLKQ
ncbi:hypothetical protein GS399_04995 [Pedobacter sp. HMF7647]|uniref:Uncharacterized protein n=1 Tax=Hufsiella arboris TaxID=2695275 RepID=A0A7K1Y7A0_9SPHI|nr:hypothetical protein [Hufsiella arboris]MXV50320.1 hypothetical protein [Hufsiella arboris]